MASPLSGMWQLACYVARHPTSQGRRLDALLRVARWQLGSRLLRAPAIVNWVEGSRLIVERGMAGATGNVYVGLHEYYDMAFVLHFLRSDDLFVDVGANVGSYTILAAVACGARTLTFEPVPSTFAHLMDNISINRCEDRVRAFNVAVGDTNGQLTFTHGLDTQNHALHPGEQAESVISVEVRPLDAMLVEPAAIIKIDVEGYESKVLGGGRSALATAGAVILELSGANGSPQADAALCRELSNHGLTPVSYDPRTRGLEPRDVRGAGGNVVFVRDLEKARERVREARAFALFGRTV